MPLDTFLNFRIERESVAAIFCKTLGRCEEEEEVLFSYIQRFKDTTQQNNRVLRNGRQK